MSVQFQFLHIVDYAKLMRGGMKTMYHGAGSFSYIFNRRGFKDKFRKYIANLNDALDNSGGDGICYIKGILVGYTKEENYEMAEKIANIVRSFKNNILLNPNYDFVTKKDEEFYTLFLKACDSVESCWKFISQDFESRALGCAYERIVEKSEMFKREEHD